MGQVNPVEIEVHGQRIRQVFNNSGAYAVYPAFGERKIVSGQRILPEQVTVDLDKISEPFDIVYEHLRGTSLGVSNILGDDIGNRVMRDFKLREMNGILVLDASYANVRPRGFDCRAITGQVEAIKYSLCRFNKTGAVVFN